MTDQLMHCIVTAGPTYEPLDKVRRLTNFSTGRLGSELVTFLTARGHDTTLLIREQAEHHKDRPEDFALHGEIVVLRAGKRKSNGVLGL